MDRLAADTFGRSYRRYLELKPTAYRWSVLAHEAVAILAQAAEGTWSTEKLADHLHCEAEEAALCRRRYTVSKKVNSPDGPGQPAGAAERIRIAFREWAGDRFGDLDKRETEAMAAELAVIVANQLFAAVRAGEDVMKLSRELEGAENEGASPSEAPPRAEGASHEGASASEPPKWGPHWKD